ncbi:Protein kinase, catalytic domain-containing protein [Cynara cardunculus var. scolymus]|uniref:Protein kinase, catalytic domain-containing protein n=1 Tax=Cynara cardunculus var. scolymus TaxID=59895 RepID=A0A103XB72_CYNCS|nr:Protein kinase, catalytic domain-containing protein [Cynara cardunculus var. scolymus]
MVAGGGDEEEKRGSGGLKNDKDLRAGVALYARAAFLGHADAMRELGQCLQDGYGVRKNVEEGRRLLVQANVRELSSLRLITLDANSLYGFHLSKGMNYLHQNYIVHRDLKAANLLLDEHDAAQDAELPVTSSISPEGMEKTTAPVGTASPSNMQVYAGVAPLMSMADNFAAATASLRMV